MNRAAPRMRDDEAVRNVAQRMRPQTSESIARLYGSQLNRMESTLNSLLEALNAPAGAELRGAHMPAAKPAASLGAAIAEVARRQRALDENWREPPREFRTADPRSAPSSLFSLQEQIAGLAAKLDEMRREQAIRHAEQPPCNLDKLRTEIGGMSQALRDLASRGSVAALEQTIRGLTQKIEASRTEGIKDNVLQPLEQLVGELRRSLAEIDPRLTIKGLEGELKRLGSKLDDLGRVGVDSAAFQNIQRQTQEIRDLLTAAVSRPMPVERIERQVAELAESIDRQRPAGGPALLPYEAPPLGKIEDRLDAIAAKVEEAIAEARDRSRYEALTRRIDGVSRDLTAKIAESVPAETRTLQDLVRNLAEKLDKAQEPSSGPQAIDALEQQIGALAKRLDASNAGFSSLTTLEETISNLFTELEKTREVTLEAAANAAAQTGTRAADPLGQDMQRLRAVQDDAERRTVSTLNAVHETLEKVVDRLALVEGELALRPKEAARDSLASGPAPVFAPAAQRAPGESKAPQIAAEERREAGKRSTMPAASGLEDFLIEPGSGFPGRRESGGDSNGRQAREPEAPATRADFIAAARRAAQAAQLETALAVSQAKGAAAAKDSAGLIRQTRNFIAQHKRPVVLSLAALFVAIGAYAVVKTMGHGQPTSLSFNVGAPAVAASDQAPQPASPPAAQVTSATLDPTPTGEAASPQAAPQAASPQAAPQAAPDSESAQMPQAQAPGVDTMPTGSIGPAKEEAREIAETNPQAAAVAGNARAQFALATIYAEGRHVTRDLAAAAQWYAKAAAQGLAPAEYRLGSFYEKGLGVARDMDKARVWYQKAAEHGNIRAMHNLAVLAADGDDDGRPDYATAAQWFRRAAEFGVRDSQYNLAVLLARGLGVPQNFVSSYTWFAIAADQGDDDAARKRDDVGLRLNPNELAAGKAMAAAFRPKTPNATANDVAAPPGGWTTSSPAPASMSKVQRPKMSEL